MQSKAFSRSQKMPPTMSFLFKSFRITLVNTYMALFLVYLVLKQNCSSANILFLLLCSQIWIYTPLSSTLENEVRIDIGLEFVIFSHLFLTKVLFLNILNGPEKFLLIMIYYICGLEDK